jgi:hypothetical protein
MIGEAGYVYYLLIINFQASHQLYTGRYKSYEPVGRAIRTNGFEP